MLISFYHISLCPRCARARRHLQELLGNDYATSVAEINILHHPVKTLENGVKMVPAISYGDDLLSGVLLSSSSIKQFLERNSFL